MSAPCLAAAPLSRRLSVPLTVALFFARSVVGAEPMAITLDQAVQTALTQHPELAAFSLDIQAVEGRILQASLPPNPEAEVDFVNLGAIALGSAPAESSVGVSQAIELGGKRPARVGRAQAERRVLEADYQKLRLDLVAAVRAAFTDLLAAQERQGLRKEAYDLASRLTETVSERVKAGAISPIEETRARVALAGAEADLTDAGREVESARLALGAAIGDPAPGFAGAAGSLPDDLSLPDWASVSKALEASPHLERWERERKQREAALALEQANVVPDVTVRAAYAYDREGPPYNLFTVGFSVPLPLRNRNQGAIAEARANLAKAAEERRGEELRLRAELAQSYANLQSAARQVRLLREGSLAGARDAYQTVDEGYRFGKFGYLDVLDANAALVDAKVRNLEALASLNRARIELERWVAATQLPAPSTGTR